MGELLQCGDPGPWDYGLTGGDSPILASSSLRGSRGLAVGTPSRVILLQPKFRACDIFSKQNHCVATGAPFSLTLILSVTS